MLRVVPRALLLTALVIASACATAHAPPPASGSAAGAASSGNESALQAGDDRASRHSIRARREMTLREYYYDVEQRTARAGGFVMWFNPPTPIRRTASVPEPQIQAAGDAPVIAPTH